MKREEQTIELREIIIEAINNRNSNTPIDDACNKIYALLCTPTNNVEYENGKSKEWNEGYNACLFDEQKEKELVSAILSSPEKQDLKDGIQICKHNEFINICKECRKEKQEAKQLHEVKDWDEVKKEFENDHSKSGKYVVPAQVFRWLEKQNYSLPSKCFKEEAIEFAEWIVGNDWEFKNHFEGQEILWINELLKETKTTTELHSLYKQSKQ